MNSSPGTPRSISSIPSTGASAPPAPKTSSPATRTSCTSPRKADLLPPPSGTGQLPQTVPPRTANRILKSAQELRETLASILYAAVAGQAPAPADLVSLERHIHAARLHQKLTSKHAGLSWEWSCPLTDPALPLWLLALSASELIATDALLRLRECGNLECRWLFLDTSKNHTRRWCDMKLCGNRMKARRFKAQQKPATSPGRTRTFEDTHFHLPPP